LWCSIGGWEARARGWAEWSIRRKRWRVKIERVRWTARVVGTPRDRKWIKFAGMRNGSEKVGK
jgi:hypothetical protein